MAGVPCFWQASAYFFHCATRALLVSLSLYSLCRAGSKGLPMWFTSTWTFPGEALGLSFVGHMFRQCRVGLGSWLGLCVYWGRDINTCIKSGLRVPNLPYKS